MRYVMCMLMVLFIFGCAQKGDIGVQGVPGSTGSQGPAGQNGLDMVATSVPITDAHCVNGGQLILTAQDNARTGFWQANDHQLSSSIICNGANGTNGVNGLDGTDATPVTIVKLCPGVSTYPSVFIESAICLNNKLYGVYSANSGFLTEILPGNWSSNAIGSSCNLTVSVNCVVSH